MTSWKEICINLKKFDVRLGLRGSVAVGAGLILGVMFGLPTIIGLSALFVSMTDFPDPLLGRLRKMGEWTLMGGVLTLVGLTLGGSMWPVVISMTLVTFLCGLAIRLSGNRSFSFISLATMRTSSSANRLTLSLKRICSRLRSRNQTPITN